MLQLRSLTGLSLGSLLLRTDGAMGRTFASRGSSYSPGVSPAHLTGPGGWGGWAVAVHMRVQHRLQWPAMLEKALIASNSVSAAAWSLQLLGLGAAQLEVPVVGHMPGLG